MKRLLLLLAILISISYIVENRKHPGVVSYNGTKPYSEFLEEDKKKRDDVWEIIKHQVFRKDTEFEDIQKFRAPILFEIYNATPKDSLAVNNIIKEFRALLPDKDVDYFKNYTEYYLNEDLPKDAKANNKSLNESFQNFPPRVFKPYTIQFRFSKDSSLFNADLPYKIKIDKERGIAIDDFRATSSYSMALFSKFNQNENLSRVSGYIQSKTHFGFLDKVTLEERQQLIEHVLVKVLSCKSIVVFDDYFYNGLGSTDKQVLQKLYSNTLLEDFKTYMHSNYPWRFATYEISPKTSKTYAVWICVCLGVIVFVIGFSALYNRRYRFKFLEYVLPLFVFLLFTDQIYKLYYYIATPNRIMGSVELKFLHISITVLACIMALLLYLVDKYLVKKGKAFINQLIIKISFTLLVFMFPGLWYMFLSSEKDYDVTHLLLIIPVILTISRALILYFENNANILVKQKELEVSQLKQYNAEAKVQLLQSQINPHFLYNALNSISSLAPIDAIKTQKMAHSLSNLFKYNLNRKGESMSTVQDEVAMVRNYLEIEQIRFGERLSFNIDVDESLLKEKIPQSLLQPLLENAVKHGVSEIEEDGRITLQILKTTTGLEIKVKDNGPEFPEGLVSGHGLQTVHDLLDITYGNQATLNWVNTPEKAIIVSIHKKVA